MHWEKLGQCRGRDVMGHSVGGALDAVAHVWDAEHQVLLGTGWHALTGEVMEVQWWSLSDFSYLKSADGDHPASAISTKS